MNQQIEFFSAVLIVSKNPERLYYFYKDTLGFPLKGEEHGETIKHYGCDLGDIHFAIHPLENFEDKNFGTGSVKMAFTVFDINAYCDQITKAGAKLVYPPKDLGFAKMTAVMDPDGNYIEFTELSDRWFQHLEKRRQSGIDIISRWKNK